MHVNFFSHINCRSYIHSATLGKKLDDVLENTATRVISKKKRKKKERKRNTGISVYIQCTSNIYVYTKITKNIILFRENFNLPQRVCPPLVI